MEPTSLTLSFKATFDSLETVHSSVQRFCAENEIVGLDQSGIINAVIEALNNIVEHTFAKRQGEVSLQASYIGGKLNIRIEDNGPPFNGQDDPQLDFDPDDLESLPEGGMGMAVIRSIMDEVSYTREGSMNVVTMVKLLRQF